MLTKGILADSCQPDDAADAGEPTGLVISMPMDGFSEAALDNLRKLVESKATLIKKALAAEALPIEVTDDRVSFPLKF